MIIITIINAHIPLKLLKVTIVITIFFSVKLHKTSELLSHQILTLISCYPTFSLYISYIPHIYKTITFTKYVYLL